MSDRIPTEYPQIAAFDLPNCRSTMIGVSFAAKTKAGNRQIFFWVPAYKNAPDRSVSMGAREVSW